MQPLSPPVFNKIATHSKNLRFFILFVFGFACFQLVVIFVDFQIPLGTQLVQNGMKMVPTTDPLGCFLIQFRPTLPKKNTTHNTTNLFFRNLGPKTRFPFTLWPTTTWNPQPTTHPFWMDLWLFWDTLKKPMFANAFSLLYTRFWQDLPRSPKICQDLPRSNKINQRIGKHKPASATCRNKSWNAELQKWGGGGVTPHGVFNKLYCSGFGAAFKNRRAKTPADIIKDNPQAPTETEIRVFPRHLTGHPYWTPFIPFYVDLYEGDWSLEPFKIQRAPKSNPKSQSGAKNMNSWSCGRHLGPVLICTF